MVARIIGYTNLREQTSRQSPEDVNMQVIVKLKMAFGPAQESLSAQSDLHTIAASFGAKASPLHPGTKDTSLGSYFVVESADQQRADALIEALRKSPAVDGAYVKPVDQPP